MTSKIINSAAAAAITGGLVTWQLKKTWSIDLSMIGGVAAGSTLATITKFGRFHASSSLILGAAALSSYVVGKRLLSPSSPTLPQPKNRRHLRLL